MNFFIQIQLQSQQVNAKFTFAVWQWKRKPHISKELWGQCWSQNMAPYLAVESDKEWARALPNLQNHVHPAKTKISFRTRVVWTLGLALYEQPRTQSFFLGTLKTLIKLGGCWVHRSFCWLSHALAQMFWMLALADCSQHITCSCT